MQGNLNYVSDLTGKCNARAEVDLYDGRQVACLPVIDLDGENIV
jgi:hypothetical protein